MVELEDAVKYVGAAYAAFVVLLLVYVAIVATRMRRAGRELDELERIVAATRGGGGEQPAAGSRSADEAGGAPGRAGEREAAQPRQAVADG